MSQQSLPGHRAPASPARTDGLNLGPVRLFPHQDVALSVLVDEAGTAQVSASWSDWSGELALFAAPLSRDIWPQTAQELSDGLGGCAQVLAGGPTPVVAAVLLEPVPHQLLVVAVTGPGWLLRAALRRSLPDGEMPDGAAVSAESLERLLAGPLGQLLADAHVERGPAPHPPGTLLALDASGLGVAPPPGHALAPAGPSARATRFAHLPTLG